MVSNFLTGSGLRPIGVDDQEDELRLHVSRLSEPSVHAIACPPVPTEQPWGKGQRDVSAVSMGGCGVFSSWAEAHGVDVS